MWPRRLHVQRPAGEKPAPISDADRALIVQAMAAGKVTVCPPHTLPTVTVLGAKPRAADAAEVEALLRVERSA